MDLAYTVYTVADLVNAAFRTGWNGGRRNVQKKFRDLMDVAEGERY